MKQAKPRKQNFTTHSMRVKKNVNLQNKIQVALHTVEGSLEMQQPN
jgi:hypothetical protein